MLAPACQARAQICLPLKKLSVTSPFGYRVNPVTGQYAFHNGIDLAADADTVYAVFAGRVTIGYDTVSGIWLKISGGELQCCYAHLSQIFFLPGDTVEAGDAVAVSGASGRVTGPHLHFSLQYRGQYIDPLKFLYPLFINQP